MYQPVPSARDRAATISAVVLVHVGLALALLNLSAAGRLPLPDEQTQLIDVTALPPPPPLVEIEPEREQPKKKEGAASARNIESEATPVVAPKPAIVVPTPQPIVASPTPRQGTEATQGASDVIGPGTGAGGSGTGTGSGGAGNGPGGGGDGIAARARLLTPGIRPRDYPPELRGRFQRSGSPFVLFTVATNGRVYDCRIYRSSGDQDIDSATCALVTARYVYRPAINQRGEAVASGNGFELRN